MRTPLAGTERQRRLGRESGRFQRSQRKCRYQTWLAIPKRQRLRQSLESDWWLGTVTQQSSSTVASGDVISESPTAGNSVNAGSAVNLVVSTGSLPASITSATPNTVPQGAQNVTITLTGLNTNFTAGVSQASFGPGITVISTFVVNSTSVKALINVDPAAASAAAHGSHDQRAGRLPMNGLTVEASATTPPPFRLLHPRRGKF